ncbi:MAG TPA: glycosyltransferase family 4 protein [Roseiflexaceae bacterium]|jgi:glycosyltransferase involved in cell wall biosynthesis|nr:glycosyltransferase family 4 protein [Roseiflexaceae bacterium]
MTDTLHVAMVVHSLNHNNIGRVYPFLRAFVGIPEVQMRLIGWDHTGTLSPLLNDLPWPVVPLRGAMTGVKAQAALAKAVEGCNVLHCFKNQAHLHTALHVAHQQHVPLVLDLDDWELGLYLEGVARWPRWRQWLWGGPITRHIADALELEQITRTEPAALVVNSTALQAHFGGSIVYTAADAALFDPCAADGTAFRAMYGLPIGAPVIGFLGTPHPHKGVDELLAAFTTVREIHPDVQLLFVGVPAHNAYHDRLLAIPGVTVTDYLEASAYPHAYGACDVIAIPQRAVTEGIMQTPAKLILAMAAARPIIATRVGDMPAILGETGMLVSPGQVQELAAALVQLLSAPNLRIALGTAARERFLAHFTLDRLRERMLIIYREARENT